MALITAAIIAWLKGGQGEARLDEQGEVRAQAVLEKKELEPNFATSRRYVIIGCKLEIESHPLTILAFTFTTVMVIMTFRAVSYGEEM